MGSRVVTPMQPDYEQIARETEERQRRLAVRAEEQRRLHEADPEHHPLYLPPDDDEFPDESYTAGWDQEEGS